MKTQITNRYTGQIGTFISHLFFTILFIGLLGFTQLAIAAPGITHNQCQPGVLNAQDTNNNGIDSNCIDNKNPSGWKTGLNSGPFARGQTIPYRSKMVNTVANTVTYTVVLEYDTTKAGEHAIDYLTTFNSTMTLANACRDHGTDDMCMVVNIDTAEIPIDPQVLAGNDGEIGTDDDIKEEDIERGVMTLYGGEFVSINPIIHTGGNVSFDPTGGILGLGKYTYPADAKRQVTVVYKTTLNGSGKGGNATGPVLAYGGHIATNEDWDDKANPQGSPYHMRYDSWTCTTLDCSTGQEDMALTETGIIELIPDIQIIKTAKTLNPDNTAIVAGEPIFGADVDDEVFYEFLVTNSGEAPLINVLVTDPLIDTGSISCPFTELATGGFMTCTGTYTLQSSDLSNGSFTNTAKAEGDYNGTTVMDEEPEVINFAPKLTLVKNLIKDNGGTASKSDWTLSAAGNTNISDAGGVSANVLAGQYTLTESAGPAGYTASKWICTKGQVDETNVVNVAVGDDITCAITNDDDAPSLKLIKSVVNDNGGTADASAWTLYAGTNSVTGSVTAVEATNQAGAYSLTESVLAGYTNTSITCDDAAGEVTSVTIGLGKTIICTFVNDDISPTLTVTKTVVNDNGGTAAPDDFLLTVDGVAVLSGVKNDFAAGAHTAAETLLAGYSAGDWGGDCAASGTITLLPGDNKTCTIINDDKAPSLKLVKMVTNDDGGGSMPSDFTLIATGPSDFSGAGPEVSSGISFDAGEYTLSESGPAGYAASAWSCVGDGSQVENKITLGLGDNATCTITNDDVETCLAGHRVTSVTLIVTQASPTPMSIKAFERKGNRITDVDIINVTGDYMDIEPNVTVFYVDPLGAAANFATQNLRFEIGPAGSEVASNMTVHLSCSDDPQVGDVHSGTAGAASATLQKVAFTTGPKSN